MQMMLILCTVPGTDEAKKMASQIVEHRLAACVNIVPGVESVYVWEGETQVDSESLLIIKTSSEKEGGLRAWLQENHPYSVPEILSINPDNINTEYKNWLMNYVQKD